VLDFWMLEVFRTLKCAVSKHFDMNNLKDNVNKLNGLLKEGKISEAVQIYSDMY